MSYCSLCECNVNEDKLDTALHAAVEKIDETAVRRLVNAGADVNSRDSWGLSPLHLVATVPTDFENGHTFKPMDEAEVQRRVRIARLLIEAGANVNGVGLSAIENNHFPVLLEAAVCQNDAVIDVLLQYGADINASSPEGRENALFWAVVTSENGDVRVVERLLANGIEVNARNEHGQTALFWAIESDTCSVELLELLLSYGADVNAKNNDGRKPCHEYMSSYPTLNNLPPGTDRGLEPSFLSLVLPNEGRVSPLREACLLHRHETVRELVKLGAADVAAKDEFGLTALYYAIIGRGAAEEKRATVRALLDLDADINETFVNLHPAAASCAESALALAIRMGDLEIVKILLEHAAKLVEIKALSEFNVNLIRDFEQLIASRRIHPYPWLTDDWASLRRDFVDWCCRCADEVRAMRETKVGKSNRVSYFDFLNVGLEQAALYARNEELVEAFEASRREGKFPIYRRFLDRKFDAGFERRKLIQRAVLRLSETLNFVDPSDFLETVLTKCANEDLMPLLDGAAVPR